MFGKDKKNSQPANEEPVVKGPSPYEVGFSGTPEELYAANKKAAAIRHYDRDYYNLITGAPQQREMHKGAIEAFLDARPDNLQTMFANPQDFGINEYNTEPLDRTKILFDLTQGNDYAPAVIKLAIGKIDEDKQQEFLDEVLLQAVKNYKNPEAFVAALLKAGANANSGRGEQPGLVLAKAIEQGQPMALVKLLLGGGANFKDSLFRMRSKSWDDAKIMKLKVYREEITGEPATVEVKPELLLQLQEQIKDLTEQVKKLQPPAPPTEAPAKKLAAKRTGPSPAGGPT